MEVSEGQLAKVVLSNMDVRNTPPLLARISNVEVNSRVDEGGSRYFVSELNFEADDRVDLIKPGWTALQAFCSASAPFLDMF